MLKFTTLEEIKARYATIIWADHPLEHPSEEALREFEEGRLYLNVRNYAPALDHFQKAADLGYNLAKVEVGLFHKHGWGVPIDYDLAWSYFEDAGDQGYFSRAMSYLYGEGTNASVRRAYFQLEMGTFLCITSCRPILYRLLIKENGPFGKDDEIAEYIHSLPIRRDK